MNSNNKFNVIDETLINVSVTQDKAIETAIKMLKMGTTVEEAALFSGLPGKSVLEIQREIL